jgi:putative ABC transport system substrate-binding protein
MPCIIVTSAFVRDGGLLSYGPDGVDLFRRAASYVDRIPRGEKPGDLPVQFPTKFEMVVNRKTANALGPCHTPVDPAARRRGHRITARYVGLWH